MMYISLADCAALVVFQMKVLHHNNICEFIGACLEINVTEIILITEYCSRGTLMVRPIGHSTYWHLLSECLSVTLASHT